MSSYSNYNKLLITEFKTQIKEIADLTNAEAEHVFRNSQDVDRQVQISLV